MVMKYPITNQERKKEMEKNKIFMLNLHLVSNFYPPIPRYVKNRVLTMFKAYHRRRINKDLLKKYIFKKFVSENGFYNYGFNEYL